MNRLQLEAAPMIPKGEPLRILGVTASQERSLKERGAFCPVVRGNGREYVSFAEVNRLARILEKERN